jgi:DNA helicase HerA-like ATPase
MPHFILPGAEDRTVVIGQTGSGKTIAAAWLLSRQRFDKRPWVALDFKRETLWDQVGSPPMIPLKLNQLPKRKGLYRLQVRPDEDEALEDWFWKVWNHGNIGIFADEASLINSRAAFKAILRQGRSLRIPVIAATQRPVDCDREIFTEAQYRMVFGVEDMARDYQVIRGLFGQEDIRDDLRGLRRHWSLWYDAKQRWLTTLRPVPPPAIVAADLRAVAPYRSIFGG